MLDDTGPSLCGECLHKSRLFANAVNCLRELKRQKPEHQGEAEMAIQVLEGRRPGAEDKYKALLLKIDRTYSQMVDQRNELQQQKNKSLDYKEQRDLNAKIKALNMVLGKLQWMWARNVDLISVMTIENEQTP